MDLGITNRVALVTGSSRGMGRAIAAALVNEGVRVAVSSRSSESIRSVAAEIGARPFVHDSGEVDDAARLVSEVQADIGPIDILVVNTGGPPPSADALALARELWESAYRSLVLTPMALIEAVVPGMRDRGWGRVVNVSSSSVREVQPALVLSNAHRSATLAAFKTLARQLAGDGVTVNTVLPGRIATDRLAQLHGSLDAAEEAARRDVPAGRLGRVEEFAAAVAFLCSERAAYVTGVALLVDGGLTRSI